MKTLLRTFLHLALIVWLGAEIFFPIVAAIAFATLRPDTHAAGAIVGELLRILHGMGRVAGTVALVMLALAPFVNMYKATQGDGAGRVSVADDGRDRLLTVRHHPGHG